MPQPRGTKVRYTRQPAAVIAVMSGMPAFSDARDIREAVRLPGGRVGLATVYRHLRVLAEQGRVDTVHGAGARPCTGCAATTASATGSSRLAPGEAVPRCLSFSGDNPVEY